MTDGSVSARAALALAPALLVLTTFLTLTHGAPCTDASLFLPAGLPRKADDGGPAMRARFLNDPSLLPVPLEFLKSGVPATAPPIATANPAAAAAAGAAAGADNASEDGVEKDAKKVPDNPLTSSREECDPLWGPGSKPLVFKGALARRGFGIEAGVSEAQAHARCGGGGDDGVKSTAVKSESTGKRSSSASSSSRVDVRRGRSLLLTLTGCCLGRRVQLDNYGHSLHGTTYSVFTALRQAGYHAAHFEGDRGGPRRSESGAERESAGPRSEMASTLGEDQDEDAVAAARADPAAAAGARASPSGVPAPLFDTVAYAWNLRKPEDNTAGSNASLPEDATDDAFAMYPWLSEMLAPLGSRTVNLSPLVERREKGRKGHAAAESDTDAGAPSSSSPSAQCVWFEEILYAVPFAHGMPSSVVWPGYESTLLSGRSLTKRKTLDIYPEARKFAWKTSALLHAYVRGRMVPAWDALHGSALGEPSAGPRDVVIVQRKPFDGVGAGGKRNYTGRAARSFVGLEESLATLRASKSAPHPLLHRVKVMDNSKRMSVAEQAAWLSKADVVIGFHGAGMTNALFSLPGTAVLELQSEGLCGCKNLHIFQNIARVNHLQYRKTCVPRESMTLVPGYVEGCLWRSSLGEIGELFSIETIRVTPSSLLELLDRAQDMLRKPRAVALRERSELYVADRPVFGAEDHDSWRRAGMAAPAKLFVAAVLALGVTALVKHSRGGESGGGRGDEVSEGGGITERTPLV